VALHKPRSWDPEWRPEKKPRVSGWTREVIDSTRAAELPDLERVVVAVVPGMPGHTTGIVAAGRSADGHRYVLGDYSMAGAPAECMEAFVAAYRKHNADVIAGVANEAGYYLDELLHCVDDEVRYEAVIIRKGMNGRAAPVVALYEQGRVHHAGTFAGLEDRMVTWDGIHSRARIGALVCAITELESR
jgi:phage terminase large subunit-like protein